MSNLFGRIFGTEKALESAVGAVSRGIDALIYTDEEKAADAASDRSEARKMVVGWMAATQGQNLARRFLAMLVTVTWALTYLTSMIMNVIAVFLDDPQKVITAAAIISNSSERVNGAVMLVLAFYFAAPHMDKIIGPAMDRFGKKV